MRFSVITIFPNLIENYTNESILGRAQDDDLIAVDTFDPRNFADNKHDQVDQKPYGGGPGMVMQAEPILKAVDQATKEYGGGVVFITSAQGNQFDTDVAKNTEKNVDHAIIICGRYEGIDRRVVEALNAREISVGPYILTGGELPALIMIDTISRFVPGVLGNENSLEEARTSGTHVYTRPETITYQQEEYTVPDVLLSGHHKKIEEWRKRQAQNTQENNS